MTCPRCSFENLPTAGFCINCGQDLARGREKTHKSPPPAPATEAERRFVTILFADLSGFTALTETHDPEMVRELVNACFDRLVPIIENHQGVVDQFVGDAIVALFGAPTAHEDDPIQACRAALEMMQALEAVNTARHVNLGLHVGINSGMVLAGGIGSRGRQQYSVLGDAVNVAARLEDAAERGEIFVGGETFKLTREHFEFVSRGTMPFKGKSEPQAVWQLLNVEANAPAHRRIYTTAPLLGRERELTLLKRVTREVWADEPGLRVVSILGEAGLGKSRLVQEWRAAAPARAAAGPPHFLVVSCVPDSAGHAYALLAALVQTLRESLPEGLSASSPLQALVGQAPGRDVPDALEGTALHARYAGALSEWIAKRAGDLPLVIVCEDLHWADAPSVQVLRRALGQLPAVRLLVGLTTRPEPEAPGWDLIHAMEELPGVSAVRLHLAPLAENDIEALLASLLPGRVPADIRQMILAHAEGNPLFVEELVRMLLERGDLKQEQEQWMRTRERMTLDVPNTLQGVLMARVDQLPPEARRVLQIASVLGREFSLEVLERMLART